MVNGPVKKLTVKGVEKGAIDLHIRLEKLLARKERSALFDCYTRPCPYLWELRVVAGQTGGSVLA